MKAKNLIITEGRAKRGKREWRKIVNYSHLSTTRDWQTQKAFHFPPRLETFSSGCITVINIKSWGGGNHKSAKKRRDKVNEERNQMLICLRHSSAHVDPKMKTQSSFFEMIFSFFFSRRNQKMEISEASLCRSLRHSMWVNSFWIFLSPRMQTRKLRDNRRRPHRIVYKMLRSPCFPPPPTWATFFENELKH